MTRQTVRAMQQTDDRKPARIERVTIAAVNATTIDLTWAGATITGIRVPGLTYTVGGTAWVWIQEPAIGPVLPAS